jgi:hypothetical protein
MQLARLRRRTAPQPREEHHRPEKGNMSSNISSDARPRKAIYGKISKVIFIANQGSEVVGIDGELLLSRLLLFDEVVVDSTNLGELPYLAKMFSVAGLEELLNRNVLKLVSQKSAVITDVISNGQRKIPLLQFGEGLSTSVDNEHNLGMKFRSLLKITGLSNARREALEGVVRSKLIKQSPSYGNELMKQIRNDLTSNVELSKTILCHRYTNVPSEKLELKAHDLGGMQRFETNLQTMLGITLEQEHEMLAEVVKATSNLNQRIADMAEYDAISHFEDSEAPLLFGKIHSLVGQLNPKFDEQAFLRVIGVTEIPKLIENRRIDVDELLRIKETDECREFRSWLVTTDSIDDEKLKSLLRGFRAKATSFIATNSGKALRLGVNTGLGLIPGYGSLVALGEGVADSFLLEKMLPSSGVLTFLNNAMPSIFASASES